MTTSQPANNQKDNHEDMRAWGKMGREGQGRKIAMITFMKMPSITVLPGAFGHNGTKVCFH